MNFQMFKLVLEKAKNPEIIANIWWIIKKARTFQKNIYFCLLTMPKPLTVWITINCGKSERDGNTRPPDLPLEKPICRLGDNS